MKKSFIYVTTVLILFIVAPQTSHAQFIEDALRLSFPGSGIGARSLGMGTASIGVADDFSASYWNPAGLGQMSMNEASFGLSNLSFGNTATYYANDQSITNSATNLNSLGLVYAVPTTQGSLVFSLGYGRQADFTTGLSFSGFNPRSSIIQSWAPDGAVYGDLSNNIAYQLYLANVDTNTGRFISPINDSLTQSGKVLEGGGLNYYTLSGAVEAAQGVYLGLTLNFISGSYSYTRNYYEDDLANVYSSYPFDLTSLSLTDAVNSDLSGFTAKLGFLYKVGPMTRLGITVKTPSWMTVHESFAERATSSFDNGDNFIYPSVDFTDHNDYDVRTPFVFSLGLAHTVENLTLAGDVEYTDWTQTEFVHDDVASAFNSYLDDLNTQIKSYLQATANIRVGAEYTLPASGVHLRAGYAYIPSPYQMDSSPNAQKYITGGLGITIENSILIDLGYAHGSWETSHIVYDQTSQTQEKITTNNLIGTVSYRF